MDAPPPVGTVVGMSESRVVRASSGNGSVEFTGRAVVVRSKGSARTVPLERVQGVEFKKSGMGAGYLRVIAAGQEQPTVGMFGKVRNRNQQLLADTSTVVFSRWGKNAEFEAVADAINAALLGE